MAKTLIFDGIEFNLELSSYCDNDRIAILMIAPNHNDDYYGRRIATINIDDYIFEANQTYMSELEFPGITQAFVNAGLATLTGYLGSSGFYVNKYPLVKLNLEAIREYCSEDVDIDSYNDDDVEWEDAADDEDVDALFRDLLGVEEDDDNE